MLHVKVQNLKNVVILQCQGRIVAGDENAILRNVVPLQAGTLVVDLIQVSGIDAGGLGALLRLQTWAQSNGIQLKLMNVQNSVQQVLEATKLDGVFESCSETGMISQLHPKVGMASASRPSLDQPKVADGKGATVAQDEGQETESATERRPWNGAILDSF